MLCPPNWSNASSVFVGTVIWVAMLMSSHVTRLSGQQNDVDLWWEVDTLWTVSGSGTDGLLLSDLRSQDLAVSRAGALLLLDRLARRVYTIDMAGVVVDSLFGEGPGPGELLRPISLTLDRDGNPAVFDRGKAALERMSITNGQALAPVPVGPGVVGLGVRIWSEDHIAYNNLDAAPDGSSRYALYSREVGEPAQMLVNGPSFHTVQVDFPTCNRSHTMIPHFTHTVPWSSNGNGVLAAAPGPEYRVEVFAQGQPRHVLTRAVEPVRVTTEIALGELADYAIGGCDIPAREALDGRAHADVFPLIKEILVAPDGEIWVERRTFSGEPSKHDIFDRYGSYVGTLTGFPSPALIVDAEHIITLSIDRFDVPSLHAILLRRQ